MRVESIARGQEFSAFSGHQGESAMGHSHSTRQMRFRAPFAAVAILMAACVLPGAPRAQGLDLRGAESPNVWRPTSAANAFAGLSLAPAPTSPTSLHLFSDYYFIDPARTGLGPRMT